MKNEKLLKAIGKIDDNLIYNTVNNAPKKKRPVWMKLSAMAACLCLVAALGVVLSKSKGAQDPVRQVVVLAHNGCCYEAVDIPAALERYGMPTTITEELTGEHVAYFKSDGIAGYDPTPLATDIELYDYAIAPCRGVYILRDGDHWYAALFVGFDDFGSSNTNVELIELYKVYNIQSSADIASIAKIEIPPLSNSRINHDKVIGTPVTDKQEIKNFYEITAALDSYGSDDYQKLAFGDVPEENAQEAYNKAREGKYTLRIETVHGLRFFIRIYPESKWVYGDGTDSYYQINDEMQAWLEHNMD